MKKQASFQGKVMTVIFLLLLTLPHSGLAQSSFSVTQCQTQEEVIALIDTVLLYNVDSAFKQNISFTGNPNSVGYYTNGGLFGFTETKGIALSTGYAGDLDHSNTCSAANASSNMGGGSDSDLGAMTNTQIYDAVIIEFDIKRFANSVFLSYVFGSEEYHDFVNSQFNDVFGFFLSGPGIEGPFINNAINIATVPGTEMPVSIQTINCGLQTTYCTAPPGNGPKCDLLFDNTDNTQESFGQVVLDAFTDPLDAAGEIQGGEWYHIKLAIGDAGDAVFDSGILLEKGSIVANPFDFQVMDCETEEDVINLVDTVLLSNVDDDNKANISFTGDPKAVGYFNNGDFLGLFSNEGIVMSNGLVNYIPDVNQCNTGANANTNNGGAVTEPDLKQLSGDGSVYDAGIIEFDVRLSSDSLALNYIFASEEYHEWVVNGNNDVFGLFVSGPGIDGEFSNNAINIGTIPGSNMPVNAGSINFGEGGITCTGKPDSCVNCQYLSDNSQTDDSAFFYLIFDGYTTSLDAVAAVQAGEWYHVKIAISDIGTAGYDSGIFLAKGTITGDTVVTGNRETLTDNWCSMMPNPAGNYLNVKVREKNAFLKITSLDGRVILKQRLIEGENTIRLSPLSPGTYIVIVSSGKKVFRDKVVHY